MGGPSGLFLEGGLIVSAPQLHKISVVAAEADVTYRSVRRAAAEGRLTLIHSGFDAAGKPLKLRVVADEQLAAFLSKHAVRRRRRAGEAKPIQ